MEIVSRRAPQVAFGSLFTTLGRWWRWRRERQELLAMDDRALRDIGITRVDAMAAARKRFWEA